MGDLHKCMRGCMHDRMFTCMYRSIQTYIYIYIYIYIHIHIRMNILSCIYVHTHRCIQNSSTSCRYQGLHNKQISNTTKLQEPHAYKNVRIQDPHIMLACEVGSGGEATSQHACICSDIHKYKERTRIHTYIYACMHYMHACIHACIHDYMHMHKYII
jgi:hypothetical protein